MPSVSSYIPSIIGSKSFAVLVLGLSIFLIHRAIHSNPGSVAVFANQTTSTLIMASPSRMPVYFLSIGGPNSFEDTQHPAYAKLGEVGREIATKVKPKAVVVFSAHWGHTSNKIAINVAEKTDLIYDFYGFPPHYYQVQFPNKGSPEVAEKVIEKLATAGIKADRVTRGLDHGVWAGFVVAFDPKKNPLDVPIVQVSLFDSEDPGQHYRMGQALESLRDEGILIIGAGMAVHNLRDYRATRGSGKTMPYTSSFDDALKDAATATPEERHAKMSTLIQSSDGRKAHPTREHILPICIAAGAAGEDRGEQLWTLPQGSLSWAQYRFGKLPAE